MHDGLLLSGEELRSSLSLHDHLPVLFPIAVGVVEIEPAIFAVCVLIVASVLCSSVLIAIDACLNIPGPLVAVCIAIIPKYFIGAPDGFFLAVGHWFDASPRALEIFKEIVECLLGVLSNLIDIFQAAFKFMDCPLDFLFKAWLLIRIIVVSC